MIVMDCVNFFNCTKLSTQDTDLSFAFDNVENLQATDMTLAEMQETEGAARSIWKHG